MKTVKKKRSEWQRFLWHIRHPWLSCRAAALYEIHRKRIIRENIEWDYQENKKYYDREFEKQWRRELHEMDAPIKYDTSVFPPVPLK